MRTRELGRQACLGSAQLGAIGVEAKQVTAGRDSTQQLAGMATVAQRAVQQHVAGLRVERANYLRNANGPVRSHSSVALGLYFPDRDNIASSLFISLRKAPRISAGVALATHVCRRLLGALLCTRSRAEQGCALGVVRGARSAHARCACVRRAKHGEGAHPEVSR